MKLAITGHTGTIGSIIYNHFPGSLGFSRTNAYDVRTNADAIVRFARDCDVFVNCAHAGPGFAQTKLFGMMYNLWKWDSSKTIINIGSDGIYVPPTPNGRADGAYKELFKTVRDGYAAEKAALLSAVQIAQVQAHDCKVSIVNPNVLSCDMKADLPGVIEFIINSKSEIKSINLQ